MRGTETKAPTFVVGQVTRVDGHIRTTAPSHAHAHQRMKKNGGNSEETEIETACYYFWVVCNSLAFASFATGAVAIICYDYSVWSATYQIPAAISFIICEF